MHSCVHCCACKPFAGSTALVALSFSIRIPHWKWMFAYMHRCKHVYLNVYLSVSVTFHLSLGNIKAVFFPYRLQSALLLRCPYPCPYHCVSFCAAIRSGQMSSWCGILRSLMESLRSRCCQMPSGYLMLSSVNCKGKKKSNNNCKVGTHACK